MANNCLVTKLKNAVPNNSLPRLGQIHIKVRSESSFTPSENNTRMYLQVSSGISFNITCTNGNHLSTTFAGLTEPKDSITLTGTGLYIQYFFDNGEYDIFIDKKYEQKALWMDSVSRYSFDLSELSYATKMDRVSVTNNGNITGDLSMIEHTPCLGELNFNDSPVTGNINSFPISINRTILFNTNVTGTIDEFVASQIAKGRTTCTEGDGIRMWDALQFPFCGKIVPNVPINEKKLYWTSTEKIWVLNDNYAVAKNASQEEIDAWKTAGKTVLVYENGDWVVK